MNKNIINFNYDNLETGDILLFRGTSFLSRIVEYFGLSDYSHVGMILKNPKFINPNLEDGIYILESSSNDTPDSEDHKFKLGVQIHLLADVVKQFSTGTVFVRKLNVIRDENFYKKMDGIHKEIHNKPYDLNPYDWLIAKINLTNKFNESDKYRKTNSFWCSALLSYVYCKLGLINEDINWSIISPKEFSSKNNTIIKFNCDVGSEICIY